MYCKSAEHLLKQNLTSDQVAAGYHPRVRHKDADAPLLQAKLSTEGQGVVRFWDADGSARELPTDWKHVRTQITFHVSHLWMKGAGLGLVANATDMRVISGDPGEISEPVCTFPL